VAATLTIPQVTLPNGTRVFGPATAADGDSAVLLSLDRTLPGGLNSLTPAATLELLIEQSNDGGATWFELVDATMTGGIHGAAKGGGNAVTDTAGSSFAPGTGRRVRATVTVAGGPITVAGTLTTS
jgi:hypothetical protein